MRRLLAAMAAVSLLAALSAAAWPARASLILLLVVAAHVLLGQALLRAARRERDAVVRRLEGARERRISELATQRRRMDRLLERLPLAVLLWEASGLAYANPAARALFPATQDGNSPQRVLTNRALAHAVHEARESGHTVRLEVQRGSRRLAAVALSTADGEVALVITDQTESHRLEAVRRDFVINASHELKTPVASMQALADTLEMALARDPDKAPGMVEGLRMEAARMGQLVRDLLDLARMEDADAQRRERVAVAAIVSAEIDRVREEAARRGVTVGTQVPDDLGVVAVPDDVQMIMANLLENAVRYNRPGGSVTVRAQRQQDEVWLEVADTGIGVADADRERLFERFYRVDRARSRAEGGTGLGLSIVRHAAQRHGGDVSVDSVLGEGSTFRVRLPAAQA